MCFLKKKLSKHSLFLQDFWIYLKDNIVERELKEISIHQFTLKMPAKANSGPGNRQDLKTHSRSPIWVAALQVIGTSSWAFLNT